MAKAKSSGANPFVNEDFAKFMDMGNLAEQFKMPGIDSNVLIETQRRNFETVTKANQMVLDGAQAILQRQTAILGQAADEAGKAATKLTEPGKPADKWVALTELFKESYELTLGRTRELTAMGAKLQGETSELLSHRVADSLDEIKGAFSPTADVN